MTAFVNSAKPARRLHQKGPERLNVNRRRAARLTLIAVFAREGTVRETSPIILAPIKPAARMIMPQLLTSLLIKTDGGEFVAAYSAAFSRLAMHAAAHSRTNCPINLPLPPPRPRLNLISPKRGCHFTKTDRVGGGAQTAASIASSPASSASS